VQDYEDVSEGDEGAEPEEVGETGKRRQAQGGASSPPAKKAKGAFVVEAVGSDDESKPAKKVRGAGQRFGSFRAFLFLASAWACVNGWIGVYEEYVFLIRWL
jgi:hypothetical protein